MVAESEDVLAEACELVEIDYEEVPGVFDPEAALDPGAPEVHEGGNLLGEWRIDRGDCDGAFAGAAVVVEGAYATQLVDHAYLEPEAGVGWLDDHGVLTLRVATQVVEHYRDVARILGLPESRRRLHLDRSPPPAPRRPRGVSRPACPDPPATRRGDGCQVRGAYLLKAEQRELSSGCTGWWMGPGAGDGGPPVGHDRQLPICLRCRRDHRRQGPSGRVGAKLLPCAGGCPSSTRPGRHE